MKRKILLAMVLSAVIAMYSLPAYASQQYSPGDIMTTSPGSLMTSSSALDIILEGTVFADLPSSIITVLMPTKVYFNVYPDDEGWNKVLSPTISASNLSSADVRLSITKAESYGAALTLQRPAGNGVRLGIAPENQISESLLSSTYLLRTSLSDASYIDLGLIGFSSPSNVGRYKIFGDAAAGEWTNGDTFSVNTIFKVTM